MTKELGEKLYDKRTIEKHIEHKLLSKDDRNKYTKSLPDDAANADYFKPEMDDKEDVSLTFSSVEVIDK